LAVFDLVQAVLGDLAVLNGDLHLQRPDIRLQDADGSFRTVRSDVPDLVQVSGKWDESSITQKNATLQFRFRRGQPFPGEPAFEWTIQGEKGEVRIISQKTAFIQLGDPTAPRVIEIHDFATDKVDTVEWDWEAWQQDLSYPARSVGVLYEAFAEVKQKGSKEKYVTMEIATKRHEQLEKLLAGWQL
jgi:predicted dehydrogenase